MLANKKTEQINVALTPEDYARAKALERTHGIKATEMGRLGIVEVMNRIDHGWADITAAERAALAEARVLHIDTVEVLRTAIGAKLSNPVS